MLAIHRHLIENIARGERIKAREFSYSSQLYTLMLGQFLHAFSLNELVDLGDVHELVEAEGVQELPEHQRVELRGVGEFPGLDPLPAGKAFDQMAWQPLDNLGENGYHSPRCLGVRFHNTVHYRTGNASKATFFIAGMTSPMVGSEAIPMSSGTGPMGC